MKHQVIGLWMLCAVGSARMLRSSTVVDQVQSGSCNGDEFSLEFALQRGCRKMGDDTSTVCCGSCDRAICQQVACIACESKVDLDEYKDQINIKRVPDGPHGSFVLPIADATTVFHSLLDLSLQTLVPGGGVISTFVDLLWPTFRNSAWDEVKAHVEALIQKDMLEQVELSLYGDTSSSAPPQSGAAYFINEFKNEDANMQYNFDQACTNIWDAITKLTSNKGGIDAHAGFPLAVVTSVMLFNFRSAAIDRFHAVGDDDMAAYAKKHLEQDILNLVPTLIEYAFTDYRDWLIKNQFYHDKEYVTYGTAMSIVETYAWKEGQITFGPGGETRSPTAIKEYLTTMMDNHIHRLIAPLYLVPTIVDKTLPPVPPALPKMTSSTFLSSVSSGPFHPWMSSNQGKCCDNLNPYTNLNDFQAYVRGNIDGMLINGILAGEMDDKQTFSYKVDGDVLSVYIKANNDKIDGLQFNTEKSQTFVSGTNKGNQFVVVQSPLSGLSTDRWVISSIRTEKPSARFVEFNFQWKGDTPSISNWNDLPNYGQPIDPTFGNFLKSIYVTAGVIQP